MWPEHRLDKPYRTVTHVICLASTTSCLALSTDSICAGLKQLTDKDYFHVFDWWRVKLGVLCDDLLLAQGRMEDGS